MKIALVHLVRRQNPPEAFSKFWQSYQNHVPGVDHEVVLLWKNFEGAALPDFAGKPAAHHVVLSDAGRDIDAYFKASKMLDHDVFVFLNSWSEINKDGWLKTMKDALMDGVGLVGASSSLESHRTNILNRFRTAWTRSSLLGRIPTLFTYGYLWLRYGMHVPPYPNFHVRTNGFMMRKEVMAQIHKPFLFDRLEAFKFESGYHGLTRQVQRKGYEVVGLDAQELIRDNRVGLPR